MPEPTPAQRAAWDQETAEARAHAAELLERFPELGARTVGGDEPAEGSEILEGLDFDPED